MEFPPILIEEFKCKFDKLYKDFKLPMTLKVHVIVHHYSDYFKETKTNGQMVSIMKPSTIQLKCLKQKKTFT